MSSRFAALLLVTFFALAAARPTLSHADEKDQTKATVATIALSGSLPESPGGPGLFGEVEQNLADMVRRLDKAADDDKIDAVVL
jgi:ClpP class serine protease